MSKIIELNALRSKNNSAIVEKDETDWLEYSNNEKSHYLEQSVDGFNDDVKSAI